MNSWTKGGIIVLLTLFTFVAIVLVAVLSVFFVYRGSEMTKNGIEASSQYRYSRYNLKTKESSHSIVSAPQKLVNGKDSNKGFLSFTNEDSTVAHLVSPFDSTEYICYGKCTCPNTERRAVGTVVSKTLTYFLAAFSSVVAMQVAKEHFSNTCHSWKIGDGPKYYDCDPTEVQADVEDCIPTDLGESGKKYKEYHCTGHCVSEEYKDANLIDLVEHFLCGESSIEWMMNEVYYPKLPEMTLDEVKMLYQNDVLVPYCENNSWKEFSYIDSEGAIKSENIKCCKGVNHPDEMNPSIECLGTEELEILEKFNLEKERREEEEQY